MKKTVSPEVSADPNGLARVVQPTGISLDPEGDESLAWLIHDVEIDIQPTQGLDATPQEGDIDGSIGFSTEESGNPMLVASQRRVQLFRENTANGGAQATLKGIDDSRMLEGTLWAAPYLVVHISVEGTFAGSASVRGLVKFSRVRIPWRTQLRLWNQVDETSDIEDDPQLAREWFNPEDPQAKVIG